MWGGRVLGLGAAFALACGVPACSSANGGAAGDGGGVPEAAPRADSGARHLDAGDAARVSDALAGPRDARGDGGTSLQTDAAPVGPGRGHPVWLHASGGDIVDAQGKTLRLFGVNRSGTEYACVNGGGIFDGPSDAASIAAMKAWKVNAVRVPLNEDCWLGINGVASQYAGATYQAAIIAFVDLLLQNGIYPIVDLHWTAPGATLATGQEPMPDSDHAPAFWTDVATKFKGEANVILELFNEPWPDNDQDTDAAWTCWQSGGACPGISYPVAGMQSLVDAVRATGAGNLLLLGGVEYSNALSQWVAHKPTDPLNNLAAAWHVYLSNTCNNQTCWEQTAGAVAKAFPVVATEVGDSACNGAFPTSVMTWLDTQNQSYLGWAWDAYSTGCSNYSLITDYTGTPTAVYGAAFQSHLASAAP